MKTVLKESAVEEFWSEILDSVIVQEFWEELERERKSEFFLIFYWRAMERESCGFERMGDRDRRLLLGGILTVNLHEVMTRGGSFGGAKDIKIHNLLPQCEL